ncbi:MAG: hypothetical protein KGL11_02270 [Alphaproteobacteria bacterium]|nr:hypothetical protein [Alphaproteobacteria bacterium]
MIKVSLSPLNRVAACAIAVSIAAFGVGRFSDAHAQTAASGGGDCWHDTTTGQQVLVGPVDTTNDDRFDLHHGANVVQLRNGHEAEQRSDGSWIDITTGQQVLVGPVDITDDDRFNLHHGANVVQLTGGHEAERVPCPPPAAPTLPVQPMAPSGSQG